MFCLIFTIKKTLVLLTWYNTDNTMSKHQILATLSLLLVRNKTFQNLFRSQDYNIQNKEDLDISSPGKIK